MSTQNQYTLSEKDKKFFFHPFTALKAHEQNGSMFIARGKDSTLFDLDGKSYLDAMAGLWCVNIGYGNEEMADAMADQVKTLSYYQAFTAMATAPAAELAARLISMSPVPMAKVFYGSSGSDANDTNAKLNLIKNILFLEELSKMKIFILYIRISSMLKIINLFLQKPITEAI